MAPTTFSWFIRSFSGRLPCLPLFRFPPSPDLSPPKLRGKREQKNQKEIPTHITTKPPPRGPSDQRQSPTAGTRWGEPRRHRARPPTPHASDPVDAARPGPARPPVLLPRGGLPYPLPLGGALPPPTRWWLSPGGERCGAARGPWGARLHSLTHLSALPAGPGGRYRHSTARPGEWGSASPPGTGVDGRQRGEGAAGLRPQSRREGLPFVGASLPSTAPVRCSRGRRLEALCVAGRGKGSEAEPSSPPSGTCNASARIPSPTPGRKVGPPRPERGDLRGLPPPPAPAEARPAATPPRFAPHPGWSVSGWVWVIYVFSWRRGQLTWGLSDARPSPAGTWGRVGVGGLAGFSVRRSRAALWSSRRQKGGEAPPPRSGEPASRRVGKRRS